MAQFIAFDPNVEVNGKTICSTLEGMGIMKPLAMKFLNEVGILKVNKREWYSQQAWLDVLKIINDKIGEKYLYLIGRNIPYQAMFPTDIDSVESALNTIDLAYHMNHRGGEIGYYRFESKAKNSGIMYCWNPYPSEFDKGIIESMIIKYSAPQASVVVELKESPANRKNGGDECEFIIKW